MDNDRNELELKAKNGDKNAQYQLGKEYMFTNDFENGVHWLRQSAAGDNGNAQAVLNLAHIYGDGLVSDFDPKGIIELYERAIYLFKNTGEKYDMLESMFGLGLIYCRGTYSNGMPAVLDPVKGCKLIDEGIAIINPNLMDDDSFDEAILNIDAKSIADGLNPLTCKRLADLFWAGIGNKEGFNNSIEYRTSIDLKRSIFFNKIFINNMDRYVSIFSDEDKTKYIEATQDSFNLELNVRKSTIEQYDKAVAMFEDFVSLSEKSPGLPITPLTVVADIFKRRGIFDYKDAAKYVEECDMRISEYNKQSNALRYRPYQDILDEINDLESKRNFLNDRLSLKRESVIDFEEKEAKDYYEEIKFTASPDMVRHARKEWLTLVGTPRISNDEYWECRNELGVTNIRMQLVVSEQQQHPVYKQEVFEKYCKEIDDLMVRLNQDNDNSSSYFRNIANKFESLSDNFKSIIDYMDSEVKADECNSQAKIYNSKYQESREREKEERVQQEKEPQVEWQVPEKDAVPPGNTHSKQKKCLSTKRKLIQGTTLAFAIVFVYLLVGRITLVFKYIKETLPSFNNNIESKPNLNNNIESKPNLNNNIESKPSLDNNTESKPKLDNNTESKPSLDDKIESKPNLDDNTETMSSLELDKDTKPIMSTLPLFSGTLIKVGARGNDVMLVQECLNRIGKFYAQSGIPSNLETDGSFGNLTKDSVIAFQKYMRLEVDGIIGPKTWDMLMEVAYGWVTVEE